MEPEVSGEARPQANDTAADGPVSVRPPSLERALVLAALLIAIDALWINQGGLSLLVGAWVILVGLPLTFLSKKFVAFRRQRLRDIGIYLSAVILVLGLNAANNRLAKSRADALVTAVKAFHAKNQRYPKTLDELVPNYLDRVPLAKYTLMFNRFTYFNLKGYVTLSYVDLPPFGRPTYDFARDKWGYLD